MGARNAGFSDLPSAPLDSTASKRGECRLLVRHFCVFSPGDLRIQPD
jgi:hypothetical protein